MLRSGSIIRILVSGTAMAAVMGAAASPAAAQSTQGATPPAATQSTAAQPEEGATPDSAEAGTADIVVTGSRIRRDPNDSALPLQIITTEEIQRNSITNPEQLVSYLTTNGTAGDNLASNVDVVEGAQRGNNGASFANLRGQGSGATLILLNSRRIAAHGLQGSAVDVNQIPFAAIERVEVLKEGASAIYGTDAIGGVINFILRKDYQGLGIQGFADVAEEGDHTILRTSAIAGYGDLKTQGFNLMGAVSWNSIPELRATQRGFVDTFQPERGLSVDTRGTPHSTLFAFAGTFFPTAASFPFIPGTTTRASGGLNVLDLPGAEGCSSIPDMDAYDAELWDIPSAGLACAWDTGRAASLLQELETVTWVGRGVVALGDHEITAEITGSDATALKRFSHLQVTPFGAQPLRYPVGAPGYDEVYNRLIQAFPELASRARAPFAFRWRCMECGRREIMTDTKTSRYVLAADGPVFSTWNYRAGASNATSESQSKLGPGYYYRGTLGSGAPDPTAPTAPGATTPGLIGALNSGLINPFLLPGQTQTPQALAALDAVSAEGVVLYGGKYSVTQLDASLSGDLFELPGGTMKAAVGVDYRKEKYRFNGDAREAAARPVIMAAPFDDVNALDGVSRSIKAAYAELLVPLFDGFELTAAGRVDDYSDFGATTNPMLAFKYRPIRSLMFRGNYNTGFRTPSFNQIHNGVNESAFVGADLADPQTCPTGRPDTSVPGCESLERAITIFDGGNSDLGPETAKMASLGVVFEPAPLFSASLDWWHIKRENTITTLTLRQLVDNYDLFPERFIRDSSGRLLTIDRRLINAGVSKTQGLEVVLRAGGDMFGGRLMGGLDGTYLLKKDEAAVPGAAMEDKLGVFTFAGDLGLRWKHNAFISFDRGPWTLALTQIFRSGYDNHKLPGVASGRITRPGLVERVDEYIIYNVSAALEVSERMRLTMGVKNLFDTDPPFAITYNTNTGGGSSWEPRVADPRGRSFTMNVDVKF